MEYFKSTYAIMIYASKIGVYIDRYRLILTI